MQLTRYQARFKETNGLGYRFQLYDTYTQTWVWGSKFSTFELAAESAWSHNNSYSQYLLDKEAFDGIR